MKFKCLYVEGYGSIVEPLKYDLDNPGIHVLQAKNGTGKTTLFSPLCWVLYGKSLKNKSSIQTWPDIQPKNFRGTKVKLTWENNEKNYEVIRYENFKQKSGKRVSHLIFKINGVSVNDKYKADIQKKIVNHLGLSMDLFKNSVIFGQKLKRIIEEDGPTKKKIFDEAFDLMYLKNAKELTISKISDINKQLSTIEDKLKYSLELRLNFKNQLDNIKHTKERFEKDKEDTIKGLKEKISFIREEIIELDKQAVINPKNNHNLLEVKLKKLDNRLNKYNELSNKSFKLEMIINNIEGKILNEKDYQRKCLESLSKVNTKCSRCFQDLSSELIKSEKDKIKQDLKESKVRLISHKKALEVPKQKLNKYDVFLKKHKYIKDKIDRLNHRIEDCKREWLNVNKVKNTIEAKRQIITQLISTIDLERSKKLNIDEDRINGLLNNVNKEIKDLEQLKIKLIKDLNIRNWLIKDPLSNSGIKAYIFDRMISSINDKLKVYCNELGFEIKFNINLESATKDFYITITQDNKLRFYEDLSGGEQQKVNVCIAFAIHDMVSMDKNINLLIIDEAFESLDSDNIEVLTNLIYLKSHDNKSIHVITHHKDFNPINAKIIPIYKKNGRTYLGKQQ